MFGRGHEFKGNRISPMQFSMLILLGKRPMYGYEVLKALRDEFGEFWTPQTGSIYPALRRLCEHGLVVSEGRDGIDYYSLSSEGVGWVIDTLRNSPRDLRFVTRYLDFISRSGAELLTAEGGASAEAPGLEPASFGQMFEGGDLDEDARVRHLLKARNHICSHLAKIDEELKRLQDHHDAPSAREA
jgi:DNA-binding PadR family transcriptional regulator